MLKFEITENLQAAFSQFAEIAGALERLSQFTQATQVLAASWPCPQR